MADPFADRRDGGRELAKRLSRGAGRDDVVVLGLPRGGVPVADEVARALRGLLDVFVVRELGVPGHEALAIATGGVRVLNENVIATTGIDHAKIEAVARRATDELERRERLYRGERDPLDVTGKTAIVVDDGLATGATMRAAVIALRERGAGSIVVAVPTASPETCAEIGEAGAADLAHPSRTIPLGEGQRQPLLARPDSPRPTGKRQSNGAEIEIGPDQGVDEDDVRD